MTMKLSKGAGVALAALLLLSVSGCTSLDYYRQAVSGQLEVVGKREPVPLLIDSAQTPEGLRARLLRLQRMRDFASAELALPDNGSYRSYADLGRPYLVWNVFAAPEFSLQAREWCYWLVGCLDYRGYFDPAEAQSQAEMLRATGLEVWVGGVPAYSTLGWFDDPLLNTFIDWPEGRLAELIFHELAHQRLYVAGDTTFNESFATTVGRLGALRWLSAAGEAGARQAYLDAGARRDSFLELVGKTRDRLDEIYGSGQDQNTLRARKRDVLNELDHRYQRWRQDWGGVSGYDAVIADGPNNAWFAALSAYTAEVPAFEALFLMSGQDFAAFYVRVDEYAALDPEERRRELAQLGAQPRRAARR